MPPPVANVRLNHPSHSPTRTESVRNSIMFQDSHRFKLTSERQILLLSIVLTLSSLALYTTRASRVYLFEQIQCFTYYQFHDPKQIDSQNGVEESLCKLHDIQYPLSIIVGIDSCLTNLPALLVLASYEQLLPVLGLRYLVILNLFCSAIGVLFSTTVFWIHQSWAIYVAPLSFIFDLIGGGEVVRTTITITCIAQLSKPDQLTKTYNYLSGVYLLAGVGGSGLGTLLLSEHVYFLNFLSTLSYALTAWIAMLIPLDCGLESKTSEEGMPILEQLEDTDLPMPPPEWPLRSHSSKTKPPLLQIFFRSWHASYLSLLTLFRIANPTFTVVLLFLINGFATQIQVLLPQYTSLVLDWPLATVNAALGLKALVTAIVLLSLPTFRKLYLEPRMTTPNIDLLVTQASLMANMVGMIGLGFSTSAVVFIISLSIFTSGAGLPDSLMTYGTLSLPPGEKLPDFYLRTGLVQTIAGLTGAPLWSGLFSLVLKSGVLPSGLPFWICAGLFGLGLVGAGALKRWHGLGA